MEVQDDPRYIKLLEILDQEVSKGMKLPWFDFVPEQNKVSICAYCIIEDDLKNKSSEEIKAIMDKALKDNNKFSQIVESVGLDASHTVCQNCKGKALNAISKRNRIMFKNILHLSSQEKRTVMSQFREYRDTTPDYNYRANPPDSGDDDFFSEINHCEDTLAKSFNGDLWNYIISPSEYYQKKGGEESARAFLEGYVIDLTNAIDSIESGDIDKTMIKNPRIVIKNIEAFRKVIMKAGRIVDDISFPISKEDFFDDRPEEI